MVTTHFLFPVLPQFRSRRCLACRETTVVGAPSCDQCAELLRERADWVLAHPRVVALLFLAAVAFGAIEGWRR